MESAPLVDCAGRPRSLATLPGYHRGRPPRNAPAAPRTNPPTPASRATPPPATFTARFAATRSNNSSARRSSAPAPNWSSVSTAPGSTTTIPSSAPYTRPSIACCARSSPPWRSAPAHLIRTGQALKARDQLGLKALNDALKGAFDTPGKAAFAPGDQPTNQPPSQACEPETGDISEAEAEQASEPEFGEPDELPATEQPQGSPPEPPALRFRQSLIRLYPGERRGISLLIDPQKISPGTPVNVALDTGLWINLTSETVPEPNRSGWSRIDANLRARVTCDPGSRLTVLAEASGETAELVVLIVRHHASGWGMRDRAQRRGRRDRSHLRPRIRHRHRLRRPPRIQSARTSRSPRRPL